MRWRMRKITKRSKRPLLTDAQSAVERELVLRLASLLWRLRRAEIGDHREMTYPRTATHYDGISETSCYRLPCRKCVRNLEADPGLVLSVATTAFQRTRKPSEPCDCGNGRSKNNENPQKERRHFPLQYSAYSPEQHAIFLYHFYITCVIR